MQKAKIISLYINLKFCNVQWHYNEHVEFLLSQYGLWSFQAVGTKLEIFLPKNQLTQRKLLNFENWFNGELSKIGHHFSNKVILKTDVIKTFQ